MGDGLLNESMRNERVTEVILCLLTDSIANIPISKTKNNYASVDCGAKVISTNQEARVSHVTTRSVYNSVG